MAKPSRPDLRVRAPELEPPDDLVVRLGELARSSAPPVTARRWGSRGTRVAAATAGFVLVGVGGSFAAGGLIDGDEPSPVRPSAPGDQGPDEQTPSAEVPAPGIEAPPTEPPTEPSTRTEPDPAEGRGRQDRPGAARPSRPADPTGPDVTSGPASEDAPGRSEDAPGRGGSVPPGQDANPSPSQGQGRGGNADRPDRPDRPGGPAQSNSPAQPDRPDQPDQPDRPDRPEPTVDLGSGLDLPISHSGPKGGGKGTRG
jgi:hypothetical protein